MEQGLLTQNEAEMIFKPYLEIFQRALHDSMAELHKGLNAMSEPLSSKEKCNVFYSQVRSKIKAAVMDCDKIRIYEKHNSVRLFIEDKALTRMKKVKGRHSKPSNVVTKRNSQFLSNQMNSLFDSTQRITCVYLVYTPDATWSNFEYYGIVCRVDDNIVWRIDNWNEGQNDLFKMQPVEPVVPVIIGDDIMKIKEA